MSLRAKVERRTRPAVDKRTGCCTALWGRHAAEDTWVVGTGTSLAGFDFSRLAGRLTIALNDALLIPGLDPAYGLFHDNGLWVRYYAQSLHPRTHVLCTQAARENFYGSERCGFKTRVLWYDHAGQPDDQPAGPGLYVDRTIATGGIHLAWKLGARRVFLLGVDGYKLREKDGSERYYWTGAEKLYDQKRAGQVVKVREKRKERMVGGLVVQDRHDAWGENMRLLKRFFDRGKVFPCKWPGSGVYNLSARSTIDAWPKITIESVFQSIDGM